MAQHRHLKYAPIREAVIEIRTIASENINIDEFNLNSPDFSLEGYVHKDVVKSGGFKIEIKEGEVIPSTLSEQLLGYRCDSTDGKYVVNFQKTRYVISRLAPYEDWEKFINEAKRIWNVYVEKSQPVKVVRIATRFVNIINIPLPINDFGDFFIAPPVLPEALPQALSSFMSRFVFPHEDMKYAATITQSFEKIEKQLECEVAPVIFDIDVYLNEQIDVNDKIWEHLDNLRIFKNRIFFECLTEKTLSLFT